jgi:hypothetical protein
MSAGTEDIPRNFIEPVREFDKSHGVTALQDLHHPLPKTRVQFRLMVFPFAVAPEDPAAPKDKMA